MSELTAHIFIYGTGRHEGAPDTGHLIELIENHFAGKLEPLSGARSLVLFQPVKGSHLLSQTEKIKPRLSVI